MAALLIAAAMFQASAQAAEKAQLHLDGIVLVKRLPLEGTRVIVIDREGPSTIISHDVGHFTLPLDLDKTYLLSFERQGCVTKQLLFDTRVPGQYLPNGPFSFPFQVTLEPVPEDAPFTYAGPVGFVRFYENIRDFGYDTDYRIARDDAFTQRLEAIRQDQVVSSAPAPPELKGTAPVPTAQAADEPQGHFEELAPTLTEVPPLVHNTEAPVLRTKPRPTPDAGSHAKAITIPTPLKTSPPAEPLASIATPLLGAPVVDERGRTEQLIVEPRRVTTVIRLSDAGHVTEYRRVAHFYGAVYFFKNGQSCPEYTFDEARQ